MDEIVFHVFVEIEALDHYVVFVDSAEINRADYEADDENEEDCKVKQLEIVLYEEIDDRIFEV